ncbi:MAG: transposase [Methylovirgula sp.]
MLSVIILCGGASAEAVVRTLAPLVDAAVRGMVRDVVLAGAPEHQLALIADHAGCAFIEADMEAEVLAGALAAARGDTLMFLHAGHIPEPGFFEEMEDLLAVGLGPHGRLLRAAPEGFLERLLPQLAPKVGLIATRPQCEAAKIVSFRHLCATRGRKALRRRLRRIT